MTIDLYECLKEEMVNGFDILHHYQLNSQSLDFYHEQIDILNASASS